MPHRVEKGIKTYKDKRVKRTSDNSWEVTNSRKEVREVLLLDNLYWYCPCEDAQYRDIMCYHIWAAICDLIGL
jgi:hypothetical protein